MASICSSIVFLDIGLGIHIIRLKMVFITFTPGIQISRYPQQPNINRSLFLLGTKYIYNCNSFLKQFYIQFVVPSSKFKSVNKHNSYASLFFCLVNGLVDFLLIFTVYIIHISKRTKKVYYAKFATRFNRIRF